MSQRSPITTHILDTSTGLPARGVRVQLFCVEPGGEGAAIGAAETDADGRVEGLLPVGPLAAGAYRLCFDAAGYFAGRGIDTFYPSVTIEFTVADPTQHYHVPLLLSPFGFSTYRGS